MTQTQTAIPIGKTRSRKSRTPQQMIEDAYEKSDSTQEAAETLEDEARRYSVLRNYLIENYFPMRRVCYEAVRSLCRDDRRSFRIAPNYTKGGNGHRVLAHARALMDFPLPGGVRLKDATSADLAKAVEFYAKQADNMQRKSVWLDRIRERVGDKTVADALSESDLQELL